MSHFTCIKTQIKERPYLIEALELMGHDTQENKVLVVNNAVHADEHPEFFQEYLIRKGRKSFVHVPTYLFQNM